MRSILFTLLFLLDLGVAFALGAGAFKINLAPFAHAAVVTETGAHK